MKLTAFSYSLPLKEPFRYSGGSIENRRGFLLKLVYDDIVMWGEAAPLPGFSSETFEEVRNQLETRTGAIRSYLEIALNGSAPFGGAGGSLLPSVSFALDTLLVHYQSRIQKIPPHRILFESPIDAVPVNAVLPLQEKEKMLAEAAAAGERGIDTFKLKVGADSGLEQEALSLLRKRFPESGIRIDANRSWNFEQAAAFLKNISNLAIEYCEEPLQELDVQAYRELKQLTGIPLALDESLSNSGSIASLVEERFADVLIIKPMVLGNFSKSFETNRIARSHDSTVVFTTCIESGPGRTMTATLTSGLGTPGIAHGLDTGRLLKMDVWHDGTYINNGYFHLPAAIGPGEEYRPDIQSIAVEKIELLP